MTTRASEVKNIWIAAGDGDLERVKELIEGSSMSPNIPDPNTYTPMHAAASYDQRPVFEYLLSKGGDPNVTDEDGETPLYTVESVGCAKWLVEHGAKADHKNLEGMTPAANLHEEFPEVAAFLRSLTGEAAPVEEEKEDYTIYEEDEDAAENVIEDAEMEGAEEGFAELSADHLSSLMAERLTEEQTAKLMERFAEVMRKCEEDGVNRDEELKQLVEDAIFSTVQSGRELGGATAEASVESDVKRSRTDGPNR